MASHFAWLGWLDSNQRMTIPKTVALPLGDTPIFISLKNLISSTGAICILIFSYWQVFFLYFFQKIYFNLVFDDHLLIINLFLFHFIKRKI